MPKQKEERADSEPTLDRAASFAEVSLAPNFIVLSARGYLVFSEGLWLF